MSLRTVQYALRRPFYSSPKIAVALGITSELHIYIYIWSEIFRSPTGKKVKPNHVGVSLRGFYVNVNMKDRVGGLRLT